MSELVKHMSNELLKILVELSKPPTDLSDTDRRILQERIHVFSSVISREQFLVSVVPVNPREKDVKH